MNNFLKIPEELRKRHQWVVWKRVERGGKTTKPPFQTNGKGAKTNDSKTWTSFEEAVAAVDSGEFDGIGFVFTEDDPYTGVDLDGMYQDGTEAPTASAIIQALSSYTELSPSGSGFHIIVKGKKPEGGCHRGKVEIYEAGRYFTMTGNVYSPLPIREAQGALDRVHREHIESPSVDSEEVSEQDVNDQEIIARLFSSENGEKLRRLFEEENGWNDLYPSQSEAEQAMCNALAFWTGKNIEQMDRIFRQSKLYRDKWDEKRGKKGTYGEITLKKAIQGVKETYRGTKAKMNNFKPAKLTPLSEIETKEVQFLWKPYIPMGKITIISADPGVGKTWLALFLASSFTKGSNGEDNPLFRGEAFEPINVWYQTRDDDVEDTLAPRAEKMGVVRDRFFVNREDDVSFHQRNTIRDFIIKNDIKLAIFDPVQAFLGAGTDMNSAVDIREGLRGLWNTARDTGCAILIIGHSNKNSGQKTQYRMMGSVDFVGIARSLIQLVRLPEDRDKILAVHTKCNVAKLGRSFMYYLDDEAGFNFDDWSDITVFDLDYPSAKPRGERLEEAMEFLKEVLYNGAKAKEDVLSEMKERGFRYSLATLDRARKELRIQTTRTNTYPTKSVWSLPEEQTCFLPDESTEDWGITDEEIAGLKGGVKIIDQTMDDDDDIFG